MLQYDMSARNFGFNVRNTNVSSTQSNFNNTPALTVSPTKTVLAGGAVLADDGYTIIELIFFLYTPEAINKKENPKPVQVSIPRSDKRQDFGLIYGKLNLDDLEPSEYTKDEPSFDDAPESFKKGVMFFPAIVVGGANRQFKLDYGSMSANYKNNYFIANLINNHICVYEHIDGGLVTLPYN